MLKPQHDFKAFLTDHEGGTNNVLEVVCNLSPAFLGRIAQTLPNAEITVDWFHIVQMFTRSLDEVRKQDRRANRLPKHSRWALLKKWGGV